MQSKFNTVFKYLLLSVLVLLILAPLLYIIYTSLQSPEDYQKWVGFSRLTIKNYIRVIKIAPIFRWYFNTILVTLIVTIGNLVMDTMAGYALARLSFPGKKLSFLFVLGVMIIPIQSYLIPLYIMMARLKWLNSYLSLTVPIMVYPFCIFLMRQFFLTIPKELEEAARIDGLGYFGTLVRIILPLSKGPLATVTILSILWTWNRLMLPATMINDPDYYVLTLGLNSLKNVHYSLPTLNMAGAMYLIGPIILAFIFFQKYFIKSAVSSGLKS